MAHAPGASVSGGVWSKIKRLALTDVAVLAKGLDRDALDRVERVLVEADFGAAAFDLTESLHDKLRRGDLRSEAAMRDWLRDQIAEQFTQVGAPDGLNLGTTPPAVIVVLGVNGVGKTTQIAKLAHRLIGEGKRVLLAAADTYRAGASEQLQVWARRLDVPCVVGTARGDPAAVAFDAVTAAQAREIDVALVDTAGRLHTHGDLMDELRKVVRVIERRCPGAPHESFLVLDGTVGQNAIQQGRSFIEAVPVTGLIITKLDGTAKGGAAASIGRELGVPIRFVGVGEGLDDLEAFDPVRFADRVLAG